MFDTRQSALSNIDYSYFQREFQIIYQPIFSLVNHQIVGFEARLRWHQDRMTLYSVDFMPMIKSAGLSLTVDCWLLRESCRQMRQWLDQGLVNETMIVSVKLFAEHLEHNQLIEQISTVLAETGLPGAMLCLELSQYKLVDARQARLDNLKYLEKLCVRLCLDNFNPTAKALDFIKNYAVHTVKIGSAKVLKQMASNVSHARRMLKQIQYFGTRVIFKGIERKTQVSLFQALGCQCYVQGGLFSKPLPHRKITRLISKPLSQSHPQTLIETIAVINKLSYIASHYLGLSVIKRYWQSTWPDQDWISVLHLTQDPKKLFESDLDLLLDQQQQQHFQTWILAFIDRCSVIIHDFASLLLKRTLTRHELFLLKMVIAKRDCHRMNCSTLKAA